jgi:hypothetical protein
MPEHSNSKRPRPAAATPASAREASADIGSSGTRRGAAGKTGMPVSW